MRLCVLNIEDLSPAQYFSTKNAKSLFDLRMIVQSNKRDVIQLRARHHYGFDHKYTPLLHYTHIYIHQRQPSRVFDAEDHLENGDPSCCRMNFNAWLRNIPSLQ